jgi:hypothetical protein
LLELTIRRPSIEMREHDFSALAQVMVVLSMNCCGSRRPMTKKINNKSIKKITSRDEFDLARKIDKMPREKKNNKFLFLINSPRVLLQDHEAKRCTFPRRMLCSSRSRMVQRLPSCRL